MSTSEIMVYIIVLKYKQITENSYLWETLAFTP